MLIHRHFCHAHYRVRLQAAVSMHYTLDIPPYAPQMGWLAAAGVLKWKVTVCILCVERNHEQSSRKLSTYIYPNFLTWERGTPLSTKYDGKGHTPFIPHLYVHHKEWICQKWLAKLQVLFFTNTPSQQFYLYWFFQMEQRQNTEGWLKV